MVPLIQLPFWISMSFALRNVTGFPIPYFKNKGYDDPVSGITTEGKLVFSISR